MFSLLGFLILRFMAEGQGVKDQNTITQVSLLGGMGGLSPMTIIVGKTLIDREVAAEAPAKTATTSLTTSGTTPDTEFPVPPVHGLSYHEAVTKLTQPPHLFRVHRIDVVKSGLPAEAEGSVIDQKPIADESLPAGGIVTVRVAVGEVLAGSELRRQDVLNQLALIEAEVRAL